MKKIISIFLLLQFLTNHTFAEELVKIPKLFMHFHHHYNEHDDTKGFFDFLEKHYSHKTEKEEHSDEDTDCNLPFKHCNNCCLNNYATLLASLPIVNEASFFLSLAPSPEYSFENDKINSICASSIWQPPKIA